MENYLVLSIVINLCLMASIPVIYGFSVEKYKSDQVTEKIRKDKEEFLWNLKVKVNYIQDTVLRLKAKDSQEYGKLLQYKDNQPL